MKLRAVVFSSKTSEVILVKRKTLGSYLNQHEEIKSTGKSNYIIKYRK